MDVALFILVAIGGVVALWLILRLLGGCLLRVLLAFAVLALIAFIVFSIVKC